jgi:hypothetical protein
MNDPSKEQLNSNLAVASLVCGILGFLGCCCICFLPLPVAGIVTGIFGLKSSKSGFAKVGIILSIVWLVLWILMFVLQLLGMVANPEFMEKLKQLQ